MSIVSEPRDVVDQPQLVVRDQRGRIADRRIVGDAALEIARAESCCLISPIMSRRAAARKPCSAGRA